MLLIKLSKFFSGYHSSHTLTSLPSLQSCAFSEKNIIFQHRLLYCLLMPRNLTNRIYTFIVSY